MAVNEGTAANFASLLNTDKVVLVDFWADWCAPCKQMGPIIDELAVDYNDQLDVVKVDTNSQPDLAGNYGVMSLPTLLFFQNGQQVKALQGGQTKRQLIKAIDSLV